MTRTQKLALIPASVALMLGGGAIAGYATLAAAQTPGSTTQSGMHQRAPGVFGTITAINGSTIAVSSKGFGPNATATTYTVDASKATVDKDGTTGSLSSLAVGDTIMVQGTVSGTSVTATKIHDGKGPGMGMGRGMMGRGRDHGVMGTVSAVNGNTITITGKDGTTYTVDASSAKVSKVVDLTVGDIKVGDTLGVQGSVSGSSVTAKHIMDGIPANPPQQNQ